MKRVLITISLAVGLSFSQNISLSYYKSYNYEKMQNYSDAIKALIPIYKEYPKSYTVNLRLGWLFFLDRKYSNALKHYKMASLTLPSSIEAKLGMARVYYTMQNYEKAIEIANSILKIDFYNYYGNYYNVLALKAKKEYKSALAIANKMLSLYPTDILFLVELGELYSKMGKKDKAKEIFKNILILDPNNITAKEHLEK